MGLIPAERIPHNGVATIRIWQANIGKTIIAHVPIRDGQVQETGDFELDGVTLPLPKWPWSSWIPPMKARTALPCFPPAMWCDELDVPGVGRLRHHDQCRHSDHLRCRRAGLYRLRTAGCHQQRWPRAGQLRAIRAHGALRWA
jgi:hypothetical protein